MTDWGTDYLEAHTLAEYSGYGNRWGVTESIWHEPVYETQWVVDREAWSQQLLSGFVCSGCGATK
jgi:hypothetical protein